LGTCDKSAGFELHETAKKLPPHAKLEYGETVVKEDLRNIHHALPAHHAK